MLFFIKRLLKKIGNALKTEQGNLKKPFWLQVQYQKKVRQNSEAENNLDPKDSCGPSIGSKYRLSRHSRRLGDGKEQNQGFISHSLSLARVLAVVTSSQVRSFPT